MSLTRSISDTFAASVCKSNVTALNAMAALEHIFADKEGIAVRLVRGTTDTDITALALRNQDGTECFIYPNAAGNGVIVTAVAP